MPITAATGTALPVTGTETVVATIAGGPFDLLTTYFQGGQFGGGGELGLQLYATVNGFLTRVAQARVMGDAAASIIDWQVPNVGASDTEDVNAGGSNYTVTVIDLSTGLPPPTSAPRQPVTITLAGVNRFDTAPSANRGVTFALAPGATGVLPLLAGYAQQMDVACSQSNLPQVTITVLADCGPGSLSAIVKQNNVGGTSPVNIASVFRQIQLPVASEYFVQITNDSNQLVNVTLTACTYSTAVTAGGAVVLNGDVIGPSNANTVIKWDNVPLDLATFGAPPDAAFPIFDAALVEWRALVLSGGATVNNAGVVTINPAGIALGGDVTGPAGANTVVRWRNQPLDPVTMAAPNPGDIPEWNGAAWVATPGSGAVVLSGNVNGPAGTNRFRALVLVAANIDLPVPDVQGWWAVAVSGLTAPHTLTLPANPLVGEVVVVTDEDGSLATQPFNVDGNGNLVEGVAIFQLNAAYPGSKGSIAIEFVGAAGWLIWADYDQNATSALTLVGNVNGPSGANRFLSLTQLGTNVDVNVVETEGWTTVRMRALTADRNVNLPAAPVNGEVVVVKDGDGSLQFFNIIVNGGANPIDEVAGPYTMTAVQNGIKGSVTLEFNSAAPAGWYLI